MNETMNALLTYIDQRQKDLLAELEAIRAIRTLLLAQDEKPSLIRGSNALRELNRILEETPHSALTPELRNIVHSAKQALMDALVPQIQLLAIRLENAETEPDIPAPPRDKSLQSPS